MTDRCRPENHVRDRTMVEDPDGSRRAAAAGTPRPVGMLLQRFVAHFRLVTDHRELDERSTEKIFAREAEQCASGGVGVDVPAPRRLRGGALDGAVEDGPQKVLASTQLSLRLPEQDGVHGSSRGRRRRLRLARRPRAPAWCVFQPLREPLVLPAQRGHLAFDLDDFIHGAPRRVPAPPEHRSSDCSGCRGCAAPGVAPA